MASKPIPRWNRAKTQITSWRIMWWERGRQDSRTFYDQASALLFKRLVEVGGRGNNRMPTQDELRRFDLLDKMVEDKPAARTAGADPGADGDLPEGAVTVAAAYRMFMAYRQSRTRQAPTKRTIDGYRYVEQHFVLTTSLADRDVATVRQYHIERWMDEVTVRARRDRREDAPLANLTINQALSKIGTMFAWACQDSSDPTGEGITPLRTLPNPVRGVRHLPVNKTQDEERDVLVAKEDFVTLITLAYRIDPFWADMVVGTVFTGCRFGEITALSAKNADAENNSILLDRRYSAGRLEPGLKGSRPGAPVTRRVRVPAPIMQMIVSLRADLGPNDLVFGGPRYGRNGHWSASTDSERWVRMGTELAAVGLPLKLSHHNLRHSYSTYLQEQGIPMAWVGLALGHKGNALKTITGRVYTHLTEPMWQKMLAVLDPIAEAVPAIRQAGYAAIGIEVD